MSASGKKIVVVRKKKVAGGGHHGGSWKVAYADFVTAMMAFFMVMWIIGMDDKTKQAIEGYFSNPVGYKKGYSSGQSPISTGSSPTTIRQTSLKLIVRNYEMKKFEQAAGRIRASLDRSAALLGSAAHVEIVVTRDGMRIELIEGGSGETFFTSGSARMKPAASLALNLIATELVDLSNPVIIEGHTDAAQFGVDASYTNWELSADRANAARRVLEAAGLPHERIQAVRGLADRDPRVPTDPMDPANRRISILLPFSDPHSPTPADSVPAADTSAPAGA